MTTIAPISASDVNKLRQQTGAGMMDCKKALTEANGNFEEAIDILRKKGQKIAVNRGDREAKEGVVLAKTTADGKRGVIIVLNCETDFVAKNADFVKYTESILDLAIASNPASVDALKALKLGNLKAEQKRAEEMKEQFDFIVCRAVTAFPEFYNWVKYKASPKSFNKITNGILCLKGGDLAEELALFKRAKVYELKDFFSEDYFGTKKLVYLPLKA